MDTYKINYQGIEYPAAEITIFKGTEDELTIQISSTRLSDRLLDDIESGSHEALELDEKIAAYITDNEFELSEDKVVEIIEEYY